MKTRSLFLPLALLLCQGIAQATPVSLWQDMAARNISSTATAADTHTYRTLLLDENQLTAHLQSTAGTAPLHITAPLPHGGYANITLQPSTVLSAELRSRYPSIQTWRIYSDHPHIHSGRAEFTARGLHIMLRSHTGEQWLIEPMQSALRARAVQRYYQSFSKRQTLQNRGGSKPFSCGVQNMQNRFATPLPLGSNTRLANRMATAQRAGQALMSYDLAMAATGEYTAEFGGSKTDAYGSLVTMVNRLNEIYERELGITFKLVSGTETVFTDPTTDPYELMGAANIIFKNQIVLDALIGNGRYDIGHVVSAGSGNQGIAHLGGVCNNAAKAQGFSASNNPLDSSFTVDYVAHELGHQLGATHTFNGLRAGCGGRNRIADTAFEPGSGSTIMSYAGICSTDNIQQHVDPQFHSGSVQQIHNLVFGGNAEFCGVPAAINNNAPRVRAGIDHTIPARTPFILSGSATDSDGDTLLYSWDQMDLGDAALLGTDTNNNALIKSNRLSNSGMRFIPGIPDLSGKAQSTSHGESLPRSSRTMNFRLSARDGKGANSHDDLKVKVHDTGTGFSILSPVDGLTTGRHSIRWQVAGTDQPPISCSKVDIAYTNDKGTTFTSLALQTPNDGGETIQLTEAAQHIRVKCSDNIFFALSGTTPHIAAYQNDSSQPILPDPTAITIADTPPATDTDTGTDGDGGGGAFKPLYLLLSCAILLVALRRRRT